MTTSKPWTGEFPNDTAEGMDEAAVRILRAAVFGTRAKPPAPKLGQHLERCCPEPKVLGGRCDNCGSWAND